METSQADKKLSRVPETRSYIGLDNFSLSARATRLIVTSWLAIANKEQLTHAIFTDIFDMEPKLKHLFGLGGIPNQDLPKQTAFTNHASNFLAFLNHTVSNIATTEGKDKIVHRCRQQGAVHAKMVLRREEVHKCTKDAASEDAVLFDPEYWLLFVSSAVTQITEAYAQRHPTALWSTRMLKLWCFSIVCYKPAVSTDMLHNIDESSGSVAEIQTAWQILLMRLVLEMKIEFYRELLRIEKEKYKI